MKMATSPLANNEPSKGILGRVNQAANIAATAHGIFQAAKWAAPHIMTGMRTAAALF